MGCGGGKKPSEPAVVHSTTLLMANEETKTEKINAVVFEEEFTGFEVDGYKMENHIRDGVYGSTFLVSKGRKKGVMKIYDKISEDPDSDLDAAFTKLMELNHENICKLESKPLSEILATKAEKSLFYSESDATKIMLQLAKAIEFLYMKDISHHSLTTSKIIVSDQNTVKILDVGLAGIYEGSSLQTSRRQKPIYMAPEIYFGEKSTWEPDVWALGAIFYELVTLAKAFDGGNTQDIQINITDQQYNKELLEQKTSQKIADMIKKILVLKADRLNILEIIGILGGESDPNYTPPKTGAPKAEEAEKKEEGGGGGGEGEGERKEESETAIVPAATPPPPPEDPVPSDDVIIFRVIISNNHPIKIIKIGVNSHKSRTVNIIDAEDSYNAGQVYISNRVFQIGGQPHYNRIWEIFSETGVIERRGDMCHGRQYPGCLVVYTPKPLIYVLGGTNKEGNMMVECECYDLAADSFHDITPLPVPKSSVCICQFNNEWLYTFGGFGGEEGSRSALERVDRVNIIPVGRRRTFRPWEQVEIGENQGWSKRMNSGAVQLGDQILVYGGYMSGSMMKEVFLFDPDKNSFTKEGELLKEDSFLYSINPVRFERKMAVLGFNADLHVFDIDTHQWVCTTRSDLGY